MNFIDTIVACASPPGRGGIGIIRVSGAMVSNIIKIIIKKKLSPRKAEYLYFYDKKNHIIDKGIALFFPSPYSFTGENVLELHCHGNPLILDILIKYIINLPKVRLAKPGEFLERAFMNNKIDLIQAESIADIINANSISAIHSSINSLQGVFSKIINKISKKFITLRSYIEANINFPDDEIESISNNTIRNSLEEIIFNIKKLLVESKQGYMIREGAKVVIAGYPNVGKSTIINALTSKNTAIVTSIPGTTRDVIKEYIYLDGLPLQIIDTAGLRVTNDQVEKIGIKNALNEILHSNHVLFVIDITVHDFKKNIDLFVKDFAKYIPNNIPISIVCNKIDLVNLTPKKIKFGNYHIIYVSGKLGYGINILRSHIKQKIHYYNSVSESRFIVRRRHLKALENTLKFLRNGKKNFNYNNNYDFLTEDLRLAHESLCEITGEFTSDELLKEIFSNFCIGK